MLCGVFLWSPTLQGRVGSCFLKGKAAMNICFWCFFLSASGNVGIPWRSSYCLLVLSSFFTEVPGNLQGHAPEDPRRNPRDRDFLFFLEIKSGSPKMTSPKELPLKTSKLTPQQRLLSCLSWAGLVVLM